MTKTTKYYLWVVQTCIPYNKSKVMGGQPPCWKIAISQQWFHWLPLNLTRWCSHPLTSLVVKVLNFKRPGQKSQTMVKTVNYLYLSNSPTNCNGMWQCEEYCSSECCASSLTTQSRDQSDWGPKCPRHEVTVLRCISLMQFSQLHRSPKFGFFCPNHTICLPPKFT